MLRFYPIDANAPVRRSGPRRCDLSKGLLEIPGGETIGPGRALERDAALSVDHIHAIGPSHIGALGPVVNVIENRREVKVEIAHARQSGGGAFAVRPR